MANVFGILTAFVLALSAFVAYKNKSAYETQISETLTQKDNLAKSQARFQTAQDSLTATEAKMRDEVEVDIAKLTEESAAQKQSNEDMRLDVETKTAKTSSNTEELDNIRAKIGDVSDIKQLADKMRQMGSEREDLMQSIVQAEASLANLSAQNLQADDQSSALRVKLDTLASGQSLPTLNTRIRSIYPTWGFVTLAAGNDAGVVTNSTLNVLRGDETVAQLLVTAVERNSASASIIPDSIVQDVTLNIGDRVVAATKAGRN